MTRAQVPFYALNAGEIDPKALGRIDLEKLRMAGESMVNFIPTVLGGMHMRPGTKYLGSTKSNAKARLIPYVFNATTTSLIEITGTTIRVRNNDALVTYGDYLTDVSNGDFASAIGTGWSNVSTTGASASISGGQLALDSTKYSFARARHAISVSTADKTKLHCLKVIVTRGPVTLRVGTSAGLDNIVSNQRLDTGTHFIAFTPNDNSISIDLEANEDLGAVRYVTFCDFVKKVDLELPSQWAEADLDDIRYAQSGSVIFIACKGYPPYKIERRGANSWGIAEYKTIGGPYVNYSGSKVRMKASNTTGNVTITADQPFFKSSMVGAVFEMTISAQRRVETFTGNDQYTKEIKVTGVGGKDGSARKWTWTATHTGNGTSSGYVQVEWSYGNPGSWAKAHGEQTTSEANVNGTYNVNDAVMRDANNHKDVVETNDNAIVYYRLKSTSFLAGQIAVSMDFAGGAQIGAFRITGYSSSTSVTAEVIKELGAANIYTDDWREGAWSDNQSWPSAVSFYDGRLWWAGLDKVYGSVSDDFYNFDPAVEGDSGPIVRSIATGPVENIGWMLPLQRLIVGTASAEVSIRSSSFDEPLTPTQFTARNASTMGSAAIQAMVVDSSGIFVQKNRVKVCEFLYDAGANDYTSRDLTRLNKAICEPGIVDLAGQRQPDTRLWFVKSNGTMAMLVYDRADEVVGWARIELPGGVVEAVCVLPSADDDIVYLVVRRTIQGQTRRYVERMTISSETEDGNGSYLVDSSIRFTTGSVATRTITNLNHLIGQQVVARGGSSDPTKLYTVSSSGQIVVDNAVTSIVVGLPYTAKFKSVKLAYASQAGTALLQKKRIDHFGLVAVNTAIDGLKIGPDFTKMTSLSSLYRGKAYAAGTIFSQYDYDMTSFGGGWSTDSRFCITCQSPYTAYIAGLVIKMNSNDKAAVWPKKSSSNDNSEDT